MTVKEARKSVGLTQQGLSNLLGIPKRTIQDWEGGRRSCPEWCERLVVEKILTLTPVKIDENMLSKALANLLHREIIEDAHIKYNISQKDMESLKNRRKDKT